jgi:hypothetical protein
VSQIIKIKSIITGIIISTMPVIVLAQNSHINRQTIVEYPQEHLEGKILYDAEITKKEIPEGIINSVKLSYPEYKISTAYRGSDGSYKIMLAMKNEKVAAFYNTDGDFLKLEADKEEETTNEHWR